MSMQRPCVQGRSGDLHGSKAYLMDNAYGQISHTHSVSAELDYPGVGPEHACLKDVGRAQYVGCDRRGCLAVFLEVSRVKVSFCP
jgi:Tryptophan synthase beta chain